ncbi:MAG TPA: nucleoside hydrolase [Ktedonobacterales bacterium]|jgi:inosine-uridine nucleoside N-ribohydrolase|nr:nucleoside hydrolase [Ktedonobacterales bacterium]
MTRLIIDTDPGIDDALALFFALAAPDVQLEAVTSVSGNVSVDKTTRNALSLLDLAGRSDVPVARGAERPLLRPAVYADYVHGRNGVGDVELPEPQHSPAAPHAVEMIIQTILGAPGEITLVALGPLTNLALAVRREPRIAEAVREVVIMGGALRVPGNVSPAAEFNIYADPHAAQIVFSAGWPLRLVSLDVTQQTVMAREQFATLARTGHPVTRTIQAMTDYYYDQFAGPRGIEGLSMHDPLCVAAAVHPDLIEWRRAYVEIELTGALTAGATVAYFNRAEDVDPSLAEGHTANILASVGVDRERFVALYLETLASAYTAQEQ